MLGTLYYKLMYMKRFVICMDCENEMTIYDRELEREYYVKQEEDTLFLMSQTGHLITMSHNVNYITEVLNNESHH